MPPTFKMHNSDNLLSCSFLGVADCRAHRASLPPTSEVAVKQVAAASAAEQTKQATVLCSIQSE